MRFHSIIEVENLARLSSRSFLIDDNSRFQMAVAKAWEDWLAVLEEDSFDSKLDDQEDLIDNLTLSCPQIFQKDCLTLY